jgi:hypothetical protein
MRATASRVIAVTPSDTLYLTGAEWNPLVAAPTITPSSVTVASDLFTLAGSGLINGDIIVFLTLGTVTGIAINTQYFIVGVSGNNFQVSLTFGGSAIDLAGANTTVATIRKQLSYNAAAPKTGVLQVTTSGTYRVLPADHFDTNLTTVAPMAAQDIYLVGGIPSVIEVRKVFLTGAASSAGIVLLTNGQ